ncbi:MAG: hypothetical protein IIB83_06860 [Bacteroidetes bacterium]|nr:hypothetical protein [Bacteroidota bacterium]
MNKDTILLIKKELKTAHLYLSANGVIFEKIIVWNGKISGQDKGKD